MVFLSSKTSFFLEVPCPMLEELLLIAG